MEVFDRFYAAQASLCLTIFSIGLVSFDARMLHTMKNGTLLRYCFLAFQHSLNVSNERTKKMAKINLPLKQKKNKKNFDNTNNCCV